jgi:peptide deformylase
MAVWTIRELGDPGLRTPTGPVTSFDRELRRLVGHLTDTMHAAGGVGLAANQVGVALRVFVYQVGDAAGHLVNPTIERTEGTQLGPEGCLSLPGMWFETPRPQLVTVGGQDQRGRPLLVTGEDLLARCLAHETDHLDGRLYLDRLDPTTRHQALRAIREAELPS